MKYIFIIGLFACEQKPESYINPETGKLEQTCYSMIGRDSRQVKCRGFIDYGNSSNYLIDCVETGLGQKKFFKKIKNPANVIEEECD